MADEPKTSSPPSSVTLRGVTGPTPIEPLDQHHLVEGFHSGEASLDDWLVRRAWENQLAGSSRTYVTTDGGRVIGYQTVRTFAILRADATRRAGREGPTLIAAILLGRLGVDTAAQGQGLGAGLLRHAMKITVAASDTVGVRLVVVNALHQETAGFHRRFGLEPSPTNPLDLMITVNDIRSRSTLSGRGGRRVRTRTGVCVPACHPPFSDRRGRRCPGVSTSTSPKMLGLAADDHSGAGGVT